MDNDEKRRRLKAYYRQCNRIAAERERLEQTHHEIGLGYYLQFGRFPAPPELPPLPPFPDELRDMTCGAKTRAGTPCKQRAIFANGRCKLHGGLSTGPRTDAGKAVSRANGGMQKRTP